MAGESGNRPGDTFMMAIATRRKIKEMKVSKRGKREQFKALTIKTLADRRDKSSKKYVKRKYLFCKKPFF